MKLYVNQLAAQLKQGLAPVYLISGDEPLQLGESADAIRAQARAEDYADRVVLTHEVHFNWNQLSAEADSLSLFAEKRIIDLRLSSNNIGKDGSQALSHYLERPPEDTLLLITCPKLSPAQQKTKWVKAINEKGMWITVWPIEGRQLLSWISARMQAQNLSTERDAITLLAARVEGNLLAARQEIDKLLLLHGPGKISTEQVIASIADSSRYDVYGLIDAALKGNITRSLRMLAGLKAEGIAPTIVLWALTREIRQLASLSYDSERGGNVAQLMAALRIWDKRKPLINQGLSRLNNRRWQQLLHQCAQTDKAIKGRSQNDPWQLLKGIVTEMAGAPAI